MNTTLLSREQLIQSCDVKLDYELFRFTNIHEEIIRSNRMKNIRGKFNIWIFGTNQDGQSIGIRVDGYQPWFYIDMLPEWKAELTWTDEKTINSEENQHIVDNYIRPILQEMFDYITERDELKYPLQVSRMFEDIEIVSKIPMIGFSNFKTVPLVKIYFKNVAQYTYNRWKMYEWFSSFPPFIEDGKPLLQPYHLNQNSESDYNLLDKFFRDCDLCFQTWYKLNRSCLTEIPSDSSIHVKRVYSMHVCDIKSLQLSTNLTQEIEDNVPSKTLKVFIRIMPISQFGALNGRPYAPDHENRFDSICTIVSVYQWSDQKDCISTVKTIFLDVDEDDVTCDYLSRHGSERELLHTFAQEFNQCDPDCVFIYDDVLNTTEYLYSRMKLHGIELNFERIQTNQNRINVNRIRSRDYINMCKMLAKKVKADIYDIRYMAQQTELMPKSQLVNFE